jgi:hypothetical protein
LIDAYLELSFPRPKHQHVFFLTYDQASKLAFKGECNLNDRRMTASVKFVCGPVFVADRTHWTAFVVDIEQHYVYYLDSLFGDELKVGKMVLGNWM